MDSAVVELAVRGEIGEAPAYLAPAAQRLEKVDGTGNAARAWRYGGHAASA